METIHYILDNWDYLLTLTLQHLWLVALAVGLAIIIGVPLGILIVRHKWLATPVLGIATIVLTIPSIALFGLMIPLFSLIGQGIGALPAITAVFLYSLLPIVRNTHTALDSLPPGLREAGRGIGMTFWQRLRWVEIPMALPVIFGGIRTAVVMNIGVMAIAAQIVKHSPLAVTGCKEMLNYSRDHSVADSLKYMATWQSGMFRPHDMMKTFQAKATKSQAQFDNLFPVKGLFED